MSNINNNLEYINENAMNNAMSFLQEAERRYRNIVWSAAQAIEEFRAKRKIILLTGPSSSGKTTTAAMLAGRLLEKGHQVSTISLDNFYKSRTEAPRLQNGDLDLESVHALDLPLLRSTFAKLIRDGACEMPEFDFSVGARKEQFHPVYLQEGDVAIVEGIHAFNPAVVESFPPEYVHKIYVSVSSRIYNLQGKIILNKRNIRFIRRMIRDYYFRNSSPEETYQLWASVQQGEDQYLFPYKDSADIRINSIHLYEMCVFKQTALQLLDTIRPDSPHYPSAQQIATSLRQFAELPKTMIPADSLLKEFVAV